MQRRLPWLLLGAVLAVGLRWLDLNPIVLPDRPAEVPGTLPETPPSGPFALWVAPARLSASAEGFSGTDWGLAWSNLLEQEFGAHRVVAVPEDAAPAEGARLVVVTRGAVAAHPDPARLAAGLETFAAHGGVVVIELPRMAGPVAVLAGLRDGSDPVLSDSPLVPGPAAPPWLPAEIGTLPAPSMGAHATATDGARVLLEREGSAALVGRPLGDGAVLGLSIDLGRLLVAWQQGVPDDDFSVPDRWTDRTGVKPVQSVDLVADERLLEAGFAFADVVERAVADEVRHHLPLPGWWMLPGAATGGLILTHDEERFGDASVFLAEHENETDVRATFLVVPDRMTAEGAQRIMDLGGEIGLHWDRGYPDPWVRTVGVSLFRPFARSIGLEEQAAAIRELAGPDAHRLHRLHGLLWGERWSGTFRALEAAGVALDSSLGPTGTIPPGFPFGTALPYHPMDSNGLPFRLWELPFTFQDDERMDRGDTARLLDISRRTAPGIVVPIFHASTMGYRPSVDVFEEWLDAVQLSRSPSRWSGTMGELARHLEGRSASTLRVITASAGELDCIARAASPGQAIHLPAATRAGPLGRLALDGAPLDPRALPAPDRFRILIPVLPGEHRITAIYGAGAR